MLVRLTAEVDIDIEGIDFRNAPAFAKEEARRIMIEEPEFYDFVFEVVDEDPQYGNMVKKEG